MIDLEKKINIKELIKENTHKFLGVSIEELNKSISDRLTQNPLISFEIDTSLDFKKAKKKFKRGYIKRLLNFNMGNVSLVSKIAKVDRRSVHRLVKNIELKKIRKDLLKPYTMKQESVNEVIESVLSDFRSVVHPIKFKKIYDNISTISDSLLKELPSEEMNLKEAEKEFEKRFLIKAFNECNNNIALTAKKIKLRYETLYRKLKHYNVL